MKMTKKHKEVIDAVRKLKERGMEICTRKDILNEIGNDVKAYNYNVIFRELEQSEELVKMQDKDGHNIQYLLVEAIDTYEDTDKVFDSILQAVEVINIKVKGFKELKDDKDRQISSLKCDVNFYKNKCDEYRDNISRLNEKIDSLKWG